ncbi:alpha/beta hydrolase [Kushneria sp. TE3]|uniref:alpha/beta hydrolase n=1 Tax=Kushneria sp. TE3 TaxID=3449832 RepID=UPI003F683A91
MPLDSQFGRWLQEAADRAPDVSAMSVAQRRAIADQANLKMQRPPLAYPVAEIRDLAIPGPAGAMTLRLYYPIVHGSSGPRPVTVFFHGGGFVTGSLATYDVICRALCRASKTIVAFVDYRLAPEHPFPAAPDDALAAVRYIGRHAGNFGGDGERLALAGDSAGGLLAALTALRVRDEGGPALRGQCLLYPMLDLQREGVDSLARNASGYGFTREARDWYIEQYLPDEAARAHPFNGLLARRDLADLPPALVMTAEFDPVCDEGAHYAALLAEQGVLTRHSHYYGMIHAFIRRLGQHVQADQAIDECGAWLRRVLVAPAG